MIEMIFKDVLNHFDIDGEFPDYLLDQTFNEVFLDGDLSIGDDTYEIAVTTRQNVTHRMFIKPGKDYPVIILSELPNGALNGVKFGKAESDVVYINEL